MREIEITADQLIARLLGLAATETVCILDSSGVGHLGSHFLLAGIRPAEVLCLNDDDVDDTLRVLDEKLSGVQAGIFTLSYDFGIKLQKITSRHPGPRTEPDVFLALFDELIVHDYATGRTYVTAMSDEIGDLVSLPVGEEFDPRQPFAAARAISDFSQADYVASVETIREHIRRGDTYQTNLTQQIHCSLASDLDAATVFRRLRHDHPAPFAAFLSRGDSTVVSASPERFFRIDRNRLIEASPIKGTRRRGETQTDDKRLRSELETSEKDRAENTMIVDLMRNDLGRVCDFGSVSVEKLCGVEEHPTLFHLVSTIRGKLRSGIAVSDILRSLFPCGSITGAPKIRTMQIIDEIEHSSRGLSMGAIGIYIPPAWDLSPIELDTVIDLNVAIRTMVISNGKAIFNVGGGVVIDSDAEKEYDESLLKAKALLSALGATSVG